MTYVAVLSATGKKLQPTSAYKARKLLKNGRAIIHKYRPMFTIKLVDREDGYTQPIEFKVDTGYNHIGISIVSEKHEYVNEERILLINEVAKHNDKRRYHRSRNIRKRHRKCRFNNRRNTMVVKDGFAPSLRNKRDIHVSLYRHFLEVLPIKKATFEMGQFDTQVLKAVEEGKPLPEGTDYQRGERYSYATLREAVFSRDNYKCACCGKGIEDHKILAIHHLNYLKKDRSNRMSNLLTVCTDCHTSKNHQPGGKLYDLKPKIKNFKGATFMTSVRWDMLKKISQVNPDVVIEVTYGAMTKLKRQELNIKKTHSNDAYAMGDLHPNHRTDFVMYEKQRRNNRVLSKFYDAKYTDVRDGKIKKGAEIGCNRTNRRELRNSEKNERIYRGHKVSKGKVTTRKKHYSYRPGDIVLFNGKKYIVNGVNGGGKKVTLKGTKKEPVLSKVRLVKHTGGWKKSN